MIENLLDLPPFPPLQWDEFRWTGWIRLWAWAGFQARLGYNGAISSPAPSNGAVRLYVGTPNGEQEVPPEAAAAAFEHLINHQEALRDAVIAGIFAYYPAWQKDYFSGFSAEDKIKYHWFMPDLSHPDQLKTMIGLGAIHLLPDTKNTGFRIGFEFGCTWDEEHGLGVMTHNAQVFEVGQAFAASG